VLKFPTLGTAVAIAALAAAPAHAQVKVRLGAETQLLDHVNSRTGVPSSTTWLTDQWRPSVVGMLGYYGQDSRIGTTFRLGATLDPPLLPFYLRAAVPLHLEPGDFFASMRAAIGTTIGPPLAKLYLELGADFPLGGAGHDFFDQQTVYVGAGLQLNL
jgi:hypothetical protein